jgi:RNA 3'-phosphate cyclase
LIEIDGSKGEGGGQILRTALTLSLITGKPFRLRRIRARRSKPGLRPQHLAALKAAAEISQAKVEGARLGSKRIVFSPGTTLAGEYHFKIGTAGSTSLLFQCIYLPLSLSGGSSSIQIDGGTHVPWSPCFDYLSSNWNHYLRKMGLHIQLELHLAGYYPKGGGELHAEISHPEVLRGLNLMERGELERISCFSLSSNLPEHVAERQAKRSTTRLSEYSGLLEKSIAQIPSPGIGSALVLLGEFEHSIVCYFGLGAKGKSAETVADEAVDQFRNFILRDGALDKFLSDQILLPLIFAEDESNFTTSEITQHLITNADVIHTFTTAHIEISGGLGERGSVHIRPVKQ